MARIPIRLTTFSHTPQSITISINQAFTSPDMMPETTAWNEMQKWKRDVVTCLCWVSYTGRKTKYITSRTRSCIGKELEGCDSTVEGCRVPIELYCRCTCECLWAFGSVLQVFFRPMCGSGRCTMGEIFEKTSHCMRAVRWS